MCSNERCTCSMRDGEAHAGDGANECTNECAIAE